MNKQEMVQDEARQVADESYSDRLYAVVGGCIVWAEPDMTPNQAARECFAPAIRDYQDSVTH